jgi:hypothetical protein
MAPKVKATDGLGGLGGVPLHPRLLPERVSEGQDMA